MKKNTLVILLFVLACSAKAQQKRDIQLFSQQKARIDSQWVCSVLKIDNKRAEVFYGIQKDFYSELMTAIDSPENNDKDKKMNGIKTKHDQVLRKFFRGKEYEVYSNRIAEVEKRTARITERSKLLQDSVQQRKIK